MKKHLKFFKYLTMPMVALTLQVGAAPSDTDSVKLSGHVPAKAMAKATLLQHLDPATEVPVTFVLPLRNKEELEALVGRMYDPADEKHYGQYLTTEEFAQRFAPTEEDYAHVIAYAKSKGLNIKGMHANRTLLHVSGSAEALEEAFNVGLHQYQKEDGQVFHAPHAEPEVPASVAAVIHGVVGLDNHAVRHTYARRKEMQEERRHGKTSEHPLVPHAGFSPNNILTAYNLTSVPAKGANQIIAMFELGEYSVSDILAYTKYYGLPTPKLKNILVNGGPGGGPNGEVTLDIELALAIAPQSQIYVYEGPNSDQGVLATYNRIATDNLAKQVSTSWGMGEDVSNAQYLQAESSIFLQMAAHGQTIYAAAGDSGAYDDSNSSALVVDDPASQPYVVAVGGTRLTLNPANGGYGSETVWNDGFGNGSGGGGISNVWAIPSWQKNVPSVFSKTRRNVPDVALNADQETGYAIFFEGQWTVYGGTSCAAPLWAAFTACVNQARVANHKPVLGFASPTLYALGLSASYAADFHDITMGNNLYYSAGPGYDNATGWGSFNGANLFNTLTH